MRRSIALSLVAVCLSGLAAGCADGGTDEAPADGTDHASKEYASKEADTTAAEGRDEVAPPTVELGAPVDNVSVVANVQLSAGATVQVPYEPAYASTKKVPYLGIAITDAAAGAAAVGGADIVDVTVEGNFPGSPEVLVTDADFHVLARGTATATKLVDHVTVEFPIVKGPKFVLVRDALWTKPMTFDLSATR